MKPYRHLNKEERYSISALLRRGFSLRDIAKDLGRSASTLSRELHRNRVIKTYDPLRADGLVRWHFPKRFNFDTIFDKDIDPVEFWLNSRPRKCLQFQTPAEALKEASVALTG